MDTKGTLIFFCGKMGAGKTTQSLRLSQELNAVLISEDDWLASLYPNEITDFNAYLHFSARLKPLVKAHVQNILNTGVSELIPATFNACLFKPKKRYNEDQKKRLFLKRKR